MKEVDIENVYTLLESLIEENNALKTVMERIEKTPKKDLNFDEVILKIEENKDLQESFNEQILASLGKEKPKEIIKSETNITKNFSVFGKGEIVNVKKMFLFSSILIFLYFTITILLKYGTDLEDLRKSNWEYETFYKYHFYLNHNQEQYDKQNYMFVTMKKIHEKNPEFMSKYNALTEEYMKDKKKMELKNELESLEE